MKTIPLFRDTNIGYGPKLPTQTTKKKGGGRARTNTIRVLERITITEIGHRET